MTNAWAYLYVDSEHAVRSGTLAGCSLTSEDDALYALVMLHGSVAAKADIRKVSEGNVSNRISTLHRRWALSRYCYRATTAQR